jgi:hypothetical protein
MSRLITKLSNIADSLLGNCLQRMITLLNTSELMTSGLGMTTQNSEYKHFLENAKEQHTVSITRAELVNTA